jgi:glycosyltransferase involved in cell wall biosynthesis
MKVLLLAPRMESAGGIQRYTITLLRALKDLLLDRSVRFLALTEVPNRPSYARLTTQLKWRFCWKAVRQAVCWQPDLVICTHLALGPIGWFLAKLVRRPYWIVVHGIEAWTLLPYWRCTALRHADGVIVTSVFSREQIVKRHRIKSERILSLPGTLDETLLNVEPAKGRSYRHLSNGQPVVLTVARMVASERYKGHDVVLQALPSVVAKIPNLAYVVVGDGDDRPRLERLAKHLGLTEYVVFTGEVSESELAALYHRSEIFVLPARTVIDDRNPKGEGFGIVFLEAMAFGKPVVGPNYGAPTEFIRDGENGILVDPEDVPSVAEALVKLLADPETARAMGQAGSDCVRECFSYGSFRERLREILASG